MNFRNGNYITTDLVENLTFRGWGFPGMTFQIFCQILESVGLSEILLESFPNQQIMTTLTIFLPKRNVKKRHQEI